MARLVGRGDLTLPRIDFNLKEIYWVNISACGIKIVLHSATSPHSWLPTSYECGEVTYLEPTLSPEPTRTTKYSSRPPRDFGRHKVCAFKQQVIFTDFPLLDRTLA